jgi:alkylated DNA repair dioxygenase AlkB
VLPTYTYAKIYAHGEVLKRHRDRPACEISITLNLKKNNEWPIWFQKPNGEEISLELNQGDAVMYLGEIADHWRNAYQGQEHAQLFLHYVRAEGSKYWAVFDQLKQQPPTLEKGTIPVAII